MTRLTVVSDYGYPAGGAEQFVCEFLARARSRFDCTLLTWESSALVPEGFVDLCAPTYGDVRSAWEAMATADVILVVTSFNVRLLAHLAQEFLTSKQTPAVTVVQTSGHSDPGSRSISVQEAWLAGLMASSDVIAVSPEVAQALRKVVPHAGDIFVIENGARLSSHSVVKRGRATVSFIGRPQPQKGFDLFVRLATQLRSTGLRFMANTVSLNPAGPGPDIELSTRLSDAELVDFFLRSDLLVVPYRRADGLPLAVLEAINCGVPVVGFDTPGVGALLKRHRQVVVDPTYEALERAVLQWLDGSLPIIPPTPGSVPSWDEQIDKYLSRLSRLGTGT